MTVFRCVVQGAFASGRTWSFRQHFSSTATTAQVATDWSAAVTGWWSDGTNGMALSYPTGTILSLTSAAMLVGVPFRETEKVITPHTLAGTLATDSLPEQVVILASLRADQVGDRNRGRIHFPAPAEDMATGGRLTTAAVTRVRTATNNLYSSMRSAGHTPVIYNRKVSKVETVDPVVQTLKTITTQPVDEVLRTLRRRVRSERAIYG